MRKGAKRRPHGGMRLYSATRFSSLAFVMRFCLFTLLLLGVSASAAAGAVSTGCLYNVHVWITPPHASAAAAAAAAANAQLLGQFVTERHVLPRLSSSSQQQRGALGKDKGNPFPFETLTPPAALNSAAAAGAAMLDEWYNLQQQQQKKEVQSGTVVPPSVEEVTEAVWVYYDDTARRAALQVYRQWTAAKAAANAQKRRHHRRHGSSSSSSKSDARKSLSTESSTARERAAAATAEEDQRTKEEERTATEAERKQTRAVSSGTRRRPNAPREAAAPDLYPLITFRVTAAAPAAAAASPAAAAASRAAAAAGVETAFMGLETTVPLGLLAGGKTQDFAAAEPSEEPAEGRGVALSHWWVRFLKWLLQRGRGVRNACAASPFVLSVHLNPETLRPYSLAVQRTPTFLSTDAAAARDEEEAGRRRGSEGDAALWGDTETSRRGDETRRTEGDRQRVVVSCALRLREVAADSAAAANDQGEQQQQQQKEQQQARLPVLQLVLPATLQPSGVWLSAEFFAGEAEKGLLFSAVNGEAKGGDTKQQQQRGEAAPGESVDDLLSAAAEAEAAAETNTEGTPPPFWRQYWWLLLGGVMLLTTMLSGAADDERRRAAAAADTQQQQQQRSQQQLPSKASPGLRYRLPMEKRK